MDFPYNFTGWTKQEKKSYREVHGKIVTLFEHVYPLLEWNTLLRLRLVCKGTKDLVDKYLREGDGFKRCPKITIYERSECEERSMAAFLSMNIPSTDLYLMNVSGTKYFEREKDSMEAFVQNEMLSKKIIHLRVRRMSSCPIGMEARLYGSLEKLESLETDEFGLPTVATAKEEIDKLSEQLQLSENSENRNKMDETFKRLKKLVLGAVRKPEEGDVYSDLFAASEALMNLCPNLEYAGGAFSSYMDASYMDAGEGKGMDFVNALGIVFRMIHERMEKGFRKLKFYDFAGFHADPRVHLKIVCWNGAPDFARLLTLCGDRGIKLYNVNASWFSGPLDGFNWMEATTPIVSMVNLHGNAVSKVVNTDNYSLTGLVPMPNLEKLVISSTSQSCLRKGGINRMVWPKLRVLEVTVDSEMMYRQATHLEGIFDFKFAGFGRRVEFREDPAESTAMLFKWLFLDIPRPTIIELSLTFMKNVRLEPLTKNVIGRLGTCCPNLKKLVLVNWPGLGDLLKRALRELRHLEDLTLDRCMLVSDDTFEVNSLNNLKKLSLLHLELIPGITDAFFKDVLPHLQKLADLTISSERAVTPTKLFRLRK